MKKAFIILLLAWLTWPSSAQKKYPIEYAHRGCWHKNSSNEFIIPENSLPAVAMAKRMGYTGIECDVRYTKDKKMVILHDGTLNRTMRRKSDYSKLTRPVRVSNLTLEELRRDYVLESENPEWRTPIPTLEELLTECKKHNIVPMLHSAIMESYHVAQEMFGDEGVCFTEGVKHLQEVRKFSDCIILLAINDGTAEENIAKLKQIGGRCGISTMNYQLYTPEFCQALTDKGYIVQASIFPTPHEAIAQCHGITYQLTDYSFMPVKRKKVIDRLKWKNHIVKYSDQHPDFHFKSTKAVKCGGIFIDVTFNGELEFTINGQKTHFLTSNGKETHYCIGQRFFNRQADIKIHSAKENATIQKIEIKIYEM